MKMGFASLAAAAALFAPGVSLAAETADGFRNSDPAVQLRIGPAGVAVAYGGVDQRYRGRGNGYGHNRYGNWVGRYEAIQIARRYGMARVSDLDFDDGYWEVEGRTYRGARIDVEISARTGRVVDVDYGWNQGGRRFRGHDHHSHRDHDGRSDWRRDDRGPRGGWDGRGDRDDRGDWRGRDDRGDRDRDGRGRGRRGN